LITVTGNGRLARDVELRSTRKRQERRHDLGRRRPPRPPGARPVGRPRRLGAPGRGRRRHLVKGQAVSFSGRFEPREYTMSSGEKRLALEVHGMAIEHGPKPRTAEPEHRRRGRPQQRGAGGRRHSVLIARRWRGRPPRAAPPATSRRRQRDALRVRSSFT
jgi:single-stranded DNA-binding protein